MSRLSDAAFQLGKRVEYLESIIALIDDTLMDREYVAYTRGQKDELKRTLKVINAIIVLEGF